MASGSVWGGEGSVSVKAEGGARCVSLGDGDRGGAWRFRAVLRGFDGVCGRDGRDCMSGALGALLCAWSICRRGGLAGQALYLTVWFSSSRLTGAFRSRLVRMSVMYSVFGALAGPSRSRPCVVAC